MSDTKDCKINAAGRRMPIIMTVGTMGCGKTHLVAQLAPVLSKIGGAALGGVLCFDADLVKQILNKVPAALSTVPGFVLELFSECKKLKGMNASKSLLWVAQRIPANFVLIISMCFRTKEERAPFLSALGKNAPVFLLPFEQKPSSPLFAELAAKPIEAMIDYFGQVDPLLVSKPETKTKLTHARNVCKDNAVFAHGLECVQRIADRLKADKSADQVAAQDAFEAVFRTRMYLPNEDEWKKAGLDVAPILLPSVPPMFKDRDDEFLNKLASIVAPHCAAEKKLHAAVSSIDEKKLAATGSAIHEKKLPVAVSAVEEKKLPETKQNVSLFKVGDVGVQALIDPKAMRRLLSYLPPVFRSLAVPVGKVDEFHITLQYFGNKRPVLSPQQQTALQKLFDLASLHVRVVGIAYWFEGGSAHPMHLHCSAFLVRFPPELEQELRVVLGDAFQPELLHITLGYTKLPSECHQMMINYRDEHPAVRVVSFEGVPSSRSVPCMFDTHDEINTLLFTSLLLHPDAASAVLSSFSSLEPFTISPFSITNTGIQLVFSSTAVSKADLAAFQEACTLPVRVCPMLGNHSAIQQQLKKKPSDLELLDSDLQDTVLALANKNNKTELASFLVLVEKKLPSLSATKITVLRKIMTALKEQGVVACGRMIGVCDHLRNSKAASEQQVALAHLSATESKSAAPTTAPRSLLSPADFPLWDSIGAAMMLRMYGGNDARASLAERVEAVKNAGVKFQTQQLSDSLVAVNVVPEESDNERIRRHCLIGSAVRNYLPRGACLVMHVSKNGTKTLLAELCSMERAEYENEAYPHFVHAEDFKQPLQKYVKFNGFCGKVAVLNTPEGEVVLIGTKNRLAAVPLTAFIDGSFSTQVGTFQGHLRFSAECLLSTLATSKSRQELVNKLRFWQAKIPAFGKAQMLVTLCFEGLHPEDIHICNYGSKPIAVALRVTVMYSRMMWGGGANRLPASFRGAFVEMKEVKEFCASVGMPFADTPLPMFAAGTENKDVADTISRYIVSEGSMVGNQSAGCFKLKELSYFLLKEIRETLATRYQRSQEITEPVLLDAVHKCFKKHNVPQEEHRERLDWIRPLIYAFATVPLDDLFTVIFPKGIPERVRVQEHFMRLLAMAFEASSSPVRVRFQAQRPAFKAACVLDTTLAIDSKTIDEEPNVVISRIAETYGTLAPKNKKPSPKDQKAPVQKKEKTVPVAAADVKQQEEEKKKAVDTISYNWASCFREWVTVLPAPDSNLVAKSNGFSDAASLLKALRACEAATGTFPALPSASDMAPEELISASVCESKNLLGKALPSTYFVVGLDANGVITGTDKDSKENHGATLRADGSLVVHLRKERLQDMRLLASAYPKIRFVLVSFVTDFSGLKTALRLTLQEAGFADLLDSLFLVSHKSYKCLAACGIHVLVDDNERLLNTVAKHQRILGRNHFATVHVNNAKASWAQSLNELRDLIADAHQKIDFFPPILSPQQVQTLTMGQKHVIDIWQAAQDKKSWTPL